MYGDEQRTKQEHIFNYYLYHNIITVTESDMEDYYLYDLTPLLKMHEKCFLENIRNNIFFTTSELRDYHYQKQRQNAFYHIQAINLPFQNFEFYYI